MITAQKSSTGKERRPSPVGGLGILRGLTWADGFVQS